MSQPPPSSKICNCSFKNLQEKAPANQGWMIYFFKETKTNIVNSLFITDNSDRTCQKLRDLKAFQVTFKSRFLPFLEKNGFEVYVRLGLFSWN
jgi:hypothetical protein